MRKSLAQCKELGLCGSCRHRPRTRGYLCGHCYEIKDRWKKNNRDRVRAYSTEWNQKNPEKRRLLQYHNYWSHTQRHLTNAAAAGKRMRDRIKRETFEAYGGIRCACCGVTEVVFLTLDHIHGNGAAHRRELVEQGIRKAHGYIFYRHLKKAGFPEGYQVLCYNCNSAKYIIGICPHNQVQILE